MISFLFARIIKGITYLRQSPNVVIVLLLLLVLPFLFLYSNKQFLDAGQSNQDRLQKDRIGLMHDVLASMLKVSSYNPQIVQTELQEIASINPDILEFRVVKRVNGEYVPLAALNQSKIGEPEEYAQLYADATGRIDESMIFEFYTVEGRQWYTFRAIESESGELYYIFTRLSLASVDNLFAATTQKAMYSLVLIYLFIAFLAFWHIRMTDYRHLYLEVKQANEMKDLFTNMIAHELRAPLTAIRGYASMIEEQVNGNEKEHAVRVRESAERLLEIVNDLLDVARIQSGRLSVEKTVVDLSPVVSKVLDELRVSGAEKSIVLAAEGVGVSHFISSDAKRLHQALTNLVSNAIKYTPEGTITVSIEEKYERIEMRVKDTGMGIASEDQKKLFAPFFRVASKDVSQITGTGLGMWITKQLIELMGGTIAVESIKGVGTHVVVTFKKAEVDSRRM